ncbi:VirB4 family type IV secretion system protein [Halocatena marina]|uniref:VirB4 family type IV secretion system protein n=1 Tax=Halocatena marina TaxID=2934937 RepID=UPI00200C3314|nr:hypothetical protein [Halocatena marina]
MTDTNSTDRPEQDSRQLILPQVDTSMSIRGKTMREWTAYIPAAVGITAALFAFLLGAHTVAGGLLAVSATLLVVFGIHIEEELSEAWYLTPRGLAEDYLSYRRLKRELPWGDEAAKLAALHGVRHVCDDGSYARHDGSRLALVGPIEGVNIDRRPARVMQRLSGQLTNGVDDILGPNEMWWGIYSTTRPATSDPHAIEREQRVDSLQNNLTTDQREIVEETAEWLRDQDEKHDGNEWRHYAVVEASPSESEVLTPENSIIARIEEIREQIISLFDREAGSNDTQSNPDSEADTDAGGEPLDDVLARRVDSVKQAIGRVEDVELTRADSAEHIEVLRAFWTNRGTTIGDAGDGSPAFGGTDSLLEQAFKRDLDGDGVTPTERMLSDGHFDVDKDTVEMAGTFCRTFWISNWPVRPGPMFLENLYTYSGIDIDVRIHAEPINRSAAVNAIEDKGIDIGAETINRAEESSFGALSIGSAEDAYQSAYHQLHATSVNAWYLNGYVSVRAGDRETLDNACDDLRNTLEADPTGCSLVASGTNQRAAIASASPAGHDMFSSEATGDRRHLALSGAFGAIFPFGVDDFSESNGLYWGRDTRTKRPVVANLFEGGTASHLFTTGISRSGKTTYVNDRLGDWFLGRDDRTLIVADTESEFVGLTEVCGGEQIVLGANDPINPWHIEPVSKKRRRKANDKLAPLTAQIDFITELTMSIIRVGLSQTATIDSDLYGFLRYAVSETYQRAGITDDLDTHHRSSPTYDDFFNVLYEIRKNPGEHTFHGTEGERAARVDRVDALFNSLIEMMDGGRYDHLRGDGTTALLDDDVQMAYLSMPDLSQSSKAAKSIGLQLALSQISEKIKRTPGKTIFAIDEAHVLYQTEETVDWLQSAARRWARYEAAMWSISQSPEEFVKSMSGTSDKQENKRQMILEQSATMQAFYSPKTDPETLSKFGMEPPQIRAVKNDLTPGRNNDYSTYLVQFDDLQGWIECRAETSPVTDAIEEAISDTDNVVEEIDEVDEAVEHQSAGITTIDGLDANTANQLSDYGIETRDDLLSTDAHKLAALTNASGDRIDGWYDAALARNGAHSDD